MICPKCKVETLRFEMVEHGDPHPDVGQMHRIPTMVCYGSNCGYSNHEWKQVDPDLESDSIRSSNYILKSKKDV